MGRGKCREKLNNLLSRGEKKTDKITTQNKKRLNQGGAYKTEASGTKKCIKEYKNTLSAFLVLFYFTLL